MAQHADAGQKNKPKRIPMDHSLFMLVRIDRYNDKGKLACQRPMWLLAIGESRHELIAQEIYEAYKQRYDHEYFFRFGKQKMLNGFQHQLMTGKKRGGSWSI